MTEQYITYGILVVLGALLGSYAAATVWRLRAKQLTYDEAQGEKVSAADKKQIAHLQKKSALADRSVCLACGRQLAWYELLPVISWLALRGKCRTCKAKIGATEFLAEVGLATAFALSFAFWPHGFETGVQQAMFVTWLAVLVLLAIHWMYDMKWQFLLNKITVFISLLAAMFAVLYYFSYQLEWSSYLVQLGLLLLILPGFYGLLYAASRRKWVGLGDVYLLVPLALMLGSWEYGVLLIFLANFIGTLVVLPGMVTKKLTRLTRVPFGPFLIAGFVATVLFGHYIVTFYTQSLLL